MQNLKHLATLKQYRICIAAVPQAISVNRDEVERSHQQFEMLPAILATPDQDPILYTYDPSGELVAVLDLFGNFPQEEQLVGWTKNWFENLQRPSSPR
jgi:hypothetical protein